MIWMFQVPDDESNFYYASYKLLIELALGTFWIWLAEEDYHGTTANTLQLLEPENWQKYAKSEPKKAQWTLVETLPKAVTRAAVAHMLNNTL